MKLFREDSDFSIRRFIALSWTILVILIAAAVTAFPNKFKIPSESFLTPVTMTIWVFYFGKKKAQQGIEKIKEKISGTMVEKGDGVTITARKYSE